VNRSALRRLERLAARVKCARCQRPLIPPPGTRSDEPDPSRLTAAEWKELTDITARSFSQCSGCGQVLWDLSAMSDEELKRAVTLLGRLHNSEESE
jgi:hypothetical protein